MAVDAIGLPIRIHPTPGQYGDRPQVEALLSGIRVIGHVIADDLGATAQIKANPSRIEKPTIECFFDKPKRFRRIALRCEETISAYMSLVHLACAMILIR